VNGNSSTASVLQVSDIMILLNIDNTVSAEIYDIYIYIQMDKCVWQSVYVQVTKFCINA